MMVWVPVEVVMTGNRFLVSVEGKWIAFTAGIIEVKKNRDSINSRFFTLADGRTEFPFVFKWDRNLRFSFEYI